MSTKKIGLFVSIIFILLIPLFFLKGKERVRSHSLQQAEIPLAIISVKSIDEFKLNQFIDQRDQRCYHQIKIGNQIWMAENLNYGKLVLNTEQKNNQVVEKTYYNNDTNIGNKMGGLYTWEEATNYEKQKSSGLLQGVCPDGWHLPSDREWTTLSKFLDSSVKDNCEGWLGNNIAILLIESKNNQTKFNLKLAGNSVSDWFFYLNQMAYFWSSSRYSNASAWYRSVANDSKMIYRGPGDIKLGMSIRCIKD